MFEQFKKKWRDGRAAWAGYNAFNALPAGKKNIVFYAETAADWAYLGPVAQALEEQGEALIRICSDSDDPALKTKQSFYVGFGTPRTLLFKTIEARAFVMTLPDLESFHLKRSIHPVRYFYIFHSIASMHRVYRAHAFDAYDSILCVGPHHKEEIRRTEEVYNLPAKELLEHGYGRLDTLIHDMEAAKALQSERKDGPLRVLVSPTWGDCSLVANGLENLLQILLDEQFDVTLRLHPMTKRHLPTLSLDLAKRFAGRQLVIDPDINTTQALVDADIMISEWSGSPLEYAFARLRPVIFVDTPPKVHNPEFDKLGLPCLEEDIRSKLGEIIAPDQFNLIPDAIRRLTADGDKWNESIRATREATVYNIGHSGTAGAQAILDSLRSYKKEASS